MTSTDLVEASVTIIRTGQTVRETSGARKLNSGLIAARMEEIKTRPSTRANLTSCWEDPVSNCFIPQGMGVTFSGWRFAWQARLGLTHLKHQPFPTQSDRCRGCHSATETMAHVQGACPATQATRLKRHKAVLERLVKAIPKSRNEILVEKPASRISSAIANSNVLTARGRKVKDQRPDLVILDHEKKHAQIVDVTLRTPTHESTLADAHTEKVNWYKELVTIMKQDKWTVEMFGFVIGSNGAWPKTNNSVMERIGISQRFGRRLAQKHGQRYN